MNLKIFNIMKKKYIIILILGIFLSNILLYTNLYNINRENIKPRKDIPIYLNSNSNSLTLEWNITWGTDQKDIGRRIANDSIGNIYLVGYTNSYSEGLDDVCLLKYDKYGNYTWNATWGGSNYDLGHDLAVDKNSDIYVTGYTDSFTVGGDDLCLVRFNENGGIIKNISYGGIATDRGEAIEVDLSSNIYIAGTTNSFGAASNNIWVLEYNQTLDLQWNITWGLIGQNRGYDIKLDSNSNIYVLGTTNMLGSSDVCLIKFDNLGNELWNITWGSSDTEYQPSFDIDSSGNIYITGDVYGSGYWDAFLAKFDSTGVYLWNITWGGNKDDNSLDIIVDQEGDIWITGGTRSFNHGFLDVFLAKFDSSGNLLTNTTMGGFDNEAGKGITLDSSNNIIIGGYTESYGAGSDDFLLLKYKEKAPISEPGVISFGNIYLIYLASCLASIIYITIKKKLKKKEKVSKDLVTI